MDVVKVLLCHADGSQTTLTTQDLAEHLCVALEAAGYDPASNVLLAALEDAA